MTMKISNLMMVVLVFSAVTLGIGSFFGGTATSLTSESDELNEFTDQFDSMNYVDFTLKSVVDKLRSFDPTNPLTWGNFVSSMIDIFTVLLSLPGMMHEMITYTMTEAFFLPYWFPTFIEITILLVVIFAAISAINKYEV